MKEITVRLNMQAVWENKKLIQMCDWKCLKSFLKLENLLKTISGSSYYKEITFNIGDCNHSFILKRKGSIFANDMPQSCINQGLHGMDYLHRPLSSVVPFSLANDSGSSVVRTVKDCNCVAYPSILHHPFTSCSCWEQNVFIASWLRCQLHARVWRLFIFVMSSSSELRTHYSCVNIHLHVLHCIHKELLYNARSTRSVELTLCCLWAHFMNGKLQILIFTGDQVLITFLQRNAANFLNDIGQCVWSWLDWNWYSPTCLYIMHTKENSFNIFIMFTTQNFRMLY
jgi:hypothetical protein